MSLPSSSKKRCISSPAASSLNPISSSERTERSLDDCDTSSMVASAASSLDVVHDPHAVKLCADMLTSLEQLKTLAEGRDEGVTRFAEEKPGADIYELTLDRVRGSLSVKRVQEIVEGLGAATREARESLAHEIEKRKADIEGLENEAAALTTKIQEDEGEGAEPVLKQLGSVHAMIGKHKKVLKELEAKREVEVKVKVQRVTTRVEAVELQVSNEEVRIVPMRDAGIYVLGGASELYNSSATLSSVERYDVAQNRWEAVAPMTCKRFNHRSAVLGGKIYAVGGWGGEKLNSVESFSPKSGRWESTAPLVTAREGCAVAAVNSRLYVAGGHDSKVFLSSLTSFDEEEAVWRQDLAPMTFRRASAGGVALHGLFYVVGGWDGEQFWKTVERYDPARNTWELVAPMHSKRAGCTATVCNGYLYALGGYDGSSVYSSVERFDPRLNRWEEVASMQCQRNAPAVAVLDGRIYAIGGEHIAGKCLSSVERYDPATDRWESVAKMSSVRAFTTAVAAS